MFSILAQCFRRRHASQPSNAPTHDQPSQSPPGGHTKAIFEHVCPDPATDSLEYIKFVLARYVPSAASFWSLRTASLCNALPGNMPNFLFTSDPALPTHHFEDALKSPVVFLDSRLEDNPQLIHTLQIKKLASDGIRHPTQITDIAELLLYLRSPTGVSAYTLFTSAIVNSTVTVHFCRRQHQRFVFDAIRAPETIVLIAKAIRLQEVVYTHASGNQVEKLENVSDAQLYCIFFAFADYVAGLKPLETDTWFHDILASIIRVANGATRHLPINPGETGPDDESYGLNPRICMLCFDARMVGNSQCDYHEQYGYIHGDINTDA
ncbi:hypothetical protein ONZ45_g19439 [Pleurotus djamor]|nr:hypothetical protein ONZ45_g19439 [Pleurotus djamor]